MRLITRCSRLRSRALHQPAALPCCPAGAPGAANVAAQPPAGKGLTTSPRSPQQKQPQTPGSPSSGAQPRWASSQWTPGGLRPSSTASSWAPKTPSQPSSRGALRKLDCTPTPASAQSQPQSGQTADSRAPAQAGRALDGAAFDRLRPGTAGLVTVPLSVSDLAESASTRPSTAPVHTGVGTGASLFGIRGDSNRPSNSRLATLPSDCIEVGLLYNSSWVCKDATVIMQAVPAQPVLVGALYLYAGR